MDQSTYPNKKSSKDDFIPFLEKNETVFFFSFGWNIFFRFLQNRKCEWEVERQEIGFCCVVWFTALCTFDFFFADTLAIFLGKLSKRVKWPNQSFLQRKSDPIFKDIFYMNDTNLLSQVNTHELVLLSIKNDKQRRKFLILKISTLIFIDSFFKWQMQKKRLTMYFCGIFQSDLMMMKSDR